jgi:hypothetical protein
LEGLLDTGDRSSVRHLRLNFIANRVARLFISWSNLYTFEHLSMSKIEFRARCMNALSFDPREWRQDATEGDCSSVPLQITYESNLKKKEVVIPAGGIKPIVVAVGDKNKHPPKAKDGGDKKRAKVTLAQDPCIKNLMFQNLPQHFPTDCIKVACPRRHDLPVTSGRLTAADKRLAVAGIDRLGQGTFKNLCLTHIKSL